MSTAIQIVFFTYQSTTPFKDDIRQLADIKQRISQKYDITSHHIAKNVTVLRGHRFGGLGDSWDQISPFLSNYILWEKRAQTFERKFSEFCQYML